MSIKQYLPGSPPGETYIIFGYTPLCGTCKVAERMVDVLAELTKLHVIKQDVNYVPALVQDYQVMSVPVLFVVKADEVAATVFKFESVTNLYEIVNKALTE
ncbi:thioredoxin family protein [Macrococcus equipercicus]|uniref:Thioredoxin family protein n=1 Tax=Macrococcus equipercicus TaxID=69967 RepID=A0A9Q9BRM5_9STAP|nr:thioredoxin family protein [Macrococcus equipercicus]KAA1042513.1 thioredoxin family protein [Macrococcus equipercicus]UTH14374.1 thioredoxin family protein [Macrococcus equipercicus]